MTQSKIIPNKDIIKKWEELAKKYNICPKKLIYGDKPYRVVF
ncbi:MAG: hypothetical protein Q8Q42_01470 [Nanoarchaeota archaeon]|nr:hypothetical protein [Nanoarchaeota archaeon]